MQFTEVESELNLYLQFTFLLSAVQFFFIELLNIEVKMILLQHSITW